MRERGATRWRILAQLTSLTQIGELACRLETLQLRGHCSKIAGNSKIEKKVKHNSYIPVSRVSNIKFHLTLSIHSQKNRS